MISDVESFVTFSSGKMGTPLSWLLAMILFTPPEVEYILYLRLMISVVLSAFELAKAAKAVDVQIDSSISIDTMIFFMLIPFLILSSVRAVLALDQVIDNPEFADKHLQHFASRHVFLTGKAVQPFEQFVINRSRK
ncbi:hypothetical protein D3C73_1190110 [compost metagenome]